jgi:surface antigen Omp85-like protein/surface antigen-like variable number repeat protein
VILAAALAALLLQAAAPEAPPPRLLREITLEGVTYFSREEVLKAIRLRPGGRFRRDPAEVADSLRAHYEAQCFMAVRVTPTYDPETGRLTLAVDEGPMKTLALENVSGGEEARVRELLGIEPGTLLRDKTVREAMDRLEKASGGAYTIGDSPPWRVEEGDEGRTLRLRIEKRRFKLRPLLSGPDASPFSNRVEGRAPGGGVDVTVFHGITENHLSVYGQAAYGFESDQWRHAVGARRSFGPGRLVTVGYEHHDSTDTDDLFRRRPIEGQRVRPIYFLAVDDYFRRTGDEAYAFVRPTPRINLGVSFRNDRHQSMPVVADDGILFFSREPRPNPPIDEGRMRTLLFTARWTKDAPLYDRWIDEQDSFLLRTVYGTPFRYAQGARFEGTYELATDALGGDFSFGRLTGQIHAARAVGTRHHLLARVLGGFTNGDPPLQRRFAMGGVGTVRGYSYKQFPGEQMVIATGEWMMATRGRWPSVVAFADGGRAWTPGVDGAGWKSSAGLGLDFRPLRRGYTRIDVAFPFQKSPGQDWARVYGMIQLPF